MVSNSVTNFPCDINVKAQDIAEFAALGREQQVHFLSEAARAVLPRSVKGANTGRFYAYQYKLSPSVVKAMRAHGHGQRIMSGRGANSGRWYFPIEILEAAVKASRSSHATIGLMLEARNRAEARCDQLEWVNV